MEYMKKYSFWMILVLGLILGAFIFFVSKNKNGVNTNEVSNVLDNVIDSIENKTNIFNKKPVDSILYAEALVKYKDARLQLDQSCRPTPAKMTFKNNSMLMVDNRSSEARVMNIGQEFTIKGYGFKIIKLSSSETPVVFSVDCGEHKNVATISIQK